MQLLQVLQQYNTVLLLQAAAAAATVSVIFTACRESIVSTTILYLHTYVQYNVKKNDKNS